MPEDYSFDAQLDKQLRRLKELLPCCPNCEHFAWRVVPHDVNSYMTTEGTVVTTAEACTLDPAHGRPPARIIAFGCPAFSPDVPF